MILSSTVELIDLHNFWLRKAVQGFDYILDVAALVTEITTLFLAHVSILKSEWAKLMRQINFNPLQRKKPKPEFTAFRDLFYKLSLCS